MLSNLSRTALIGGWLALLAIIVAISVVMGARLSTTAIVLVLGSVPVFVVLVLVGGAPSTSMTQILHALESKDGRR